MHIRTLSVWLLACVVTAPASAATMHRSTPMQLAGEKGCSETVLVENADDSGTGSLRAAVDLVCTGGTITFADRFLIDLESEIAIDSAVIIDGSSQSADASASDGNLVQILGGADHRSFLVTATGELTLRRLRVSDGVAPDQGGGVRNLGRLRVFDSRFDGNTDNGSNSLGGGAIFNAVDAILLVDGTTFDGNQAVRGAAIFNSGQAELRNSTFSGNVGTTNEGALQNRGTLLAIHITVANNGGENAGFGGLFAFNADTTLVNSIFADNVGNNCFLSGGTGVATGLLAESGNCGSQFSTDPQLQALLANGGATNTHALPATSIAIDAADSEFCLVTDQRGFSRPQGAGCDLGALEVRGPFVFSDGFEAAPVGAFDP